MNKIVDWEIHRIFSKKLKKEFRFMNSRKFTRGEF